MYLFPGYRFVSVRTLSQAYMPNQSRLSRIAVLFACSVCEYETFLMIITKFGVPCSWVSLIAAAGD